MERGEAREWLDRAFQQLGQGDFGAAANSFRRVRDESPDAQARSIARRGLDWYCISAEKLVAALQRIRHPVSLQSLLIDVLHLKADAAEYEENARDVAGLLRELRMIRCVDDQLWVHEDHVRPVIGQVVAELQISRCPAYLGSMLADLFLQSGGGQLSVNSRSLGWLRRELDAAPGVSVLDDCCAFDDGALLDFRKEMIEQIRRRGKPLRLREAVDAMPWPDTVKAKLQETALKTRMRAGQQGLVEIADGWFFVLDALDITTPHLDDLFHPLLRPLSTQQILARLLLPERPQPLEFTDSFVQYQSRRLAKNSSLVRIGRNKWLPNQALGSLYRQVADMLRQATEPTLLDGLLASLPDLSVEDHNELCMAVAPMLRRDPSLLEVTSGVWLHSAALCRGVERAYELLVGDSVPRSVSQLLAECLAAPSTSGQVEARLLRSFEELLVQDDRFLLRHPQEDWTALPRGIRINNLAYRVLYEEHQPLNRHEIVECAKRKPHSGSLAFQLESDSRFKRLADGRWVLASWVLINDLAAVYLSRSPIPLLAETIVQKICELHGFALIDVIFDPFHDPRFVRTALGKWECPSPGKSLDPALLDRIVQVASKNPSGVSLEILIQTALHEPPGAFQGLEEALRDDTRLLQCDGLWYPRDQCLHRVTPTELAIIKSSLAGFGFPMSARGLAARCLDLPVCLTDLEDKLSLEPDFVDLGAAGWSLKDLRPDLVGRGRAVNYPIRSGKYVPAIDPESLVAAEEEKHGGGERGGKGQAAQAERQVHSLTITLSFEDIRDGSLVVTSPMRRLLGESVELQALKFMDDQGQAFSCWNDTVNSLVHGFGAWISGRGLTFGDQIRIFSGQEKGQFRLAATGGRDEQAHLEGMRRSQVQSLLQEALSAKLSYHDLVLQVLEYFGTPIHLDDLWSMVSYRRSARKSTLRAILSAQPYFVSDGHGHWQLDKEKYAQMINDLKRQVRRLTTANQQLQSQLDAMQAQAEGFTSSQRVEHLEQSLAEAQRESEQIRAEMAQLRASIQARDAAAQRVAAEVEKQKGLLAQLQIDLECSKSETDSALARAKEAETSLSQVQDECRDLKVALAAAEVELMKALAVLGTPFGRMARWWARRRGASLPLWPLNSRQ